MSQFNRPRLTSERVFQQLAQQVASRYGVAEVEASILGTYDPPQFVVAFRLAPSQLPDCDGWDEAPEAESMPAALDNLHQALRQRAAAYFFSAS